MVLLAIQGGWFYANRQFDKVEKVDVDVDGESVLAGDSGGTNWLLVGTDAREGTEGNRSDTMLVLRTGDGPAKLLSIPRDTLVPIPSQGGEVARINSAYNDGPVALIQAVQEGIGIPIDRYIEIDFGSFGGLVDALGGVTINFPNPAIDTHSGLNVEQAGDVNLDGEQALAYVRSRFFQEVIDGEVQPADGLGDLSRVQRQQTFLRAVLAEAGASRNPFRLNKIGMALLDGLRVDNHMELIDALRFAWAMGQLNPEVMTLPTEFIEGSGAVNLADSAQAVITDFSTKG
jgi:LCP family protein required for cell wall assembly